MASLPTQSAKEAWDSLPWESGRLERVEVVNHPLDLPAMPNEAGLYRVTWTHLEGWELLRKTVKVKASKKFEDDELSFEARKPPVLLTIGRTTNLRGRIRQHFGINPHNNRVWKRLADLFEPRPRPGDSAFLDLIAKSVMVAWVPEPDWVRRCVLERYGFAVELPILDFDAEH